MEGGQALQPAEIAEVADIRPPGLVALRQPGDGDAGQQDIGHGAGEQRGGHDPDRLFHGELEARGGLGDGLEAHESPGGQGDDVQDLAEGARLVLRKGQLRVPGRTALPPQHGESADQDAREQRDGKDRLDPYRRAFSVDAQSPAQQDRSHAHQRLAEIDVVAQDGVVEAELECTGKQESADQGQGRGVGPDDSNVNQHQEPRAEKAVVVAEHLRRVGERASGVGVAVHQIVVVDADDQHDHRAEGDAEGGPQRPGHGQERSPRHDESAPSYGAAEGQSPYADRGQIFSEVLTLRQGHRFVFHIDCLPRPPGSAAGSAPGSPTVSERPAILAARAIDTIFLFSYDIIRPSEAFCNRRSQQKMQKLRRRDANRETLRCSGERRHEIRTKIGIAICGFSHIIGL